MKRYAAILSAIVIASAALTASAVEKKADQLFYEGNAFYEAREYAKAFQDYDAIMTSGIESGNLYYNIGNSFFKMGKIGYAILFYEKAKRIMPDDSDLKSNLAYAASLVDEPYIQPTRERGLVKLINQLFDDFSLNMITAACGACYIIVVAMLLLFIVRPSAARRAAFAFWVFFAIFVINLAALGTRFYDEEVLKKGVVVAKGVECKYEPIDSSTTYYTLREGARVNILSARNGWLKIERLDGKIGWVDKEAVKQI